ncbi:MAG: glycosyltransferase, partial [Candidatus Aminicenantes bacterium]|nr:glycosyltransferase [Candidatus Aminicenantes bacterium]
GIDESLFKKVDLVKIDEIKKNYNINDKIIIGDIGYHDKKAGTDFIIEVYIKASKKIPNLALMIVGGGPEIIRLKYKYRNEKNILFIGPVPQEEVANYFLATDIGVLPYINHPSVHARFPIRLLDFIAARKIVISWPFGDLRLLNFPNVIIAERQVDKWVEAISKAIDIKWQPEWDYLLKELSMKKIIDDFKKQIFVLLEEKKIKY